MGIKNFHTYGEIFFTQRKIFRRSESPLGKREWRSEGGSCFGEFTVQDACSRLKDFSRHVVQELALPTEVETSYDSAYDRCGVYIDLSSFTYGRIMKSLENSETFAKYMTSLENADETKTVVCELDKNTIDRVVKDCTETLVSELAPLLLKAYSVYLAYDKSQPKAKYFEQTRRSKRIRFHLATASRESCYENITARVKNFIIETHLNTLEKLTLGVPASGEAIEKRLFQSDDATRRLEIGEGEWKCFYRMYRDITEDRVDVCYVFGRDWDIGLAMTLYQHPRSPDAIKFVHGPNDLFEHKKRFDEKERMLHFVSLALFGNDYIGGLVNLSSNNANLVKKEVEKMYTGDAGPGTSQQVEYVSTSLFVNNSLNTSAEEEEDDADKRRNLGRAFATVVARLLCAVYGNGHDLHPDMVEGVLHHADIVGPFTTRSTVGPCEDALKLREYLARKRIENENYQSAATDNNVVVVPSTKRKADTAKAEAEPNENTTITCRDANGNLVMRTLQQCMDIFASSLLWYLSYTTFFFRSPSGRELMEKANNAEDIPMIVGMCMGRQATFRYNDPRLSQRFDIFRLLELKRALQNINCCLLYWIIESAFDRAFESK